MYPFKSILYTWLPADNLHRALDVLQNHMSSFRVVVEVELPSWRSVASTCSKLATNIYHVQQKICVWQAVPAAIKEQKYGKTLWLSNRKSEYTKCFNKLYHIMSLTCLRSTKEKKSRQCHDEYQRSVWAEGDNEGSVVLGPHTPYQMTYEHAHAFSYWCHFDNAKKYAHSIAPPMMTTFFRLLEKSESNFEAMAMLVSGPSATKVISPITV